MLSKFPHGQQLNVWRGDYVYAVLVMSWRRDEWCSWCSFFRVLGAGLRIFFCVSFVLTVEASPKVSRFLGLLSWKAISQLTSSAPTLIIYPQPCSAASLLLRSYLELSLLSKQGPSADIERRPQDHDQHCWCRLESCWDEGTVVCIDLSISVGLTDCRLEFSYIY